MDTNIFSKTHDIKNALFDFTFKELTNLTGEQEAKRIFTLLYKSKSGKRNFTLSLINTRKDLNTVKYVFELPDGNLIETVSIKRRTGTTLCISTQAGCAVRCRFCASGKNGLIRNLACAEIVQQVLLVKETVNRIVFMGIGEPLHNYQALIKAIHILRDRNGLNFPTDGMTISTVAPLKPLKKLREEHLKIQLTVSLHASNQKTRNLLIPGMKNQDINEVVASAISYSERHKRKVTIAYLLLPGVNDFNTDKAQLKRWFKGKNIRINLLPLNKTTAKLRKASKEELVLFKKELEKEGLEVNIRESQGENIDAACGQLVNCHNMKQAKITSLSITRGG
jgi:23S rRNA (adenine2503-C2)-methyltransferase